MTWARTTVARTPQDSSHAKDDVAPHLHCRHCGRKIPKSLSHQRASCIFNFYTRYIPAFSLESKMKNDTRVDTLHAAILDLVKRTKELLSRQASNPAQRMLVALAGVPGSGKSTVSDALLAELAARNIKDVAVVPMVCGVRLWCQKFLTKHRTVSTTPGKSCRHSRMRS